MLVPFYAHNYQKYQPRTIREKDQPRIQAVKHNPIKLNAFTIHRNIWQPIRALKSCLHNVDAYGYVCVCVYMLSENIKISLYSSHNTVFCVTNTYTELQSIDLCESSDSIKTFFFEHAFNLLKMAATGIRFAPERT